MKIDSGFASHDARMRDMTDPPGSLGVVPTYQNVAASFVPLQLPRFL